MNAKLWFKTFLAAILIMLTAAAVDSYAATYRSAQTGNWGTLSTWESWNGASWVAAAAYPTAGDIVTIQTGHTVSQNLVITVADLTIEASAILQTSYALTVSGTLQVDATGTLTTSTSLTSSTLFTLNGAATLGGDAAINALTIGGDAVLKPDAGIRTITLTGNLTVATTANSEQVEYRNTPSGTGRLNWTLNGSAKDITNGLASGANLKFNNLTITGTYPDVDAAFYVYGNFAVNSGNLSCTTPSTIYFDNVDNGGAKTITNTAGTLNFFNLSVATDASVTAGSLAPINVRKDLTVQSSGLLTVNYPQNIYMKGTTAGAAITANGTLQLNGSGINRGTLYIDNAGAQYVTLATNLANVDGAVIVIANGLFNIAAYTISGSGNFTLNAGSTLKLNNNDGVAGAILVTNARTFSATANYIFMGGKTGFTSAARASGANSNITTVNDFWVGTSAEANVAVTSTESFNVSRSFTVSNPTSGNNSFVASSGTITFSTASAVISNEGGDETVTFNDLAISNVSGTVTVIAVNKGINIAGSLALSSSGAFDISNAIVNFIGTGTFSKSAGQTLLAHSGRINVGTTTYPADLTLAFNLNLGASGTLTMDNDNTRFNIGAYTLQGTSAPAIILTDGTLAFAKNGGFIDNFPSYALNNLSIAKDVNLEYNGSPTTLGSRFGFNVLGTATANPGQNVVNITNLTINSTNATGIVNTDLVTPASMTISGNLAVNGTSVVDIAYNPNNAFIFTGGASLAQAKTITVASSATLSMSSMTISSGGTGYVTSTSNFTVKGPLATASGTDYFESTSGMVTLTNATGGNLITPNATAVGNIIFNDVTFAPTNTAHPFVPGTDGNMTVKGNFYFTGAASSSFSATGGKVLMSNSATPATAKLVSKSNAGSILTFWNLEIAGNVKTATGSSSSTISIASTADDALKVTSGSLLYTAGQMPTIQFTGTNAGNGVVTNTGDSLVFYNVMVSAAITAESDGFYVDKDMTVYAAYTATSGTITFRGAPSTLTIGAAFTPAGIFVPAGATLNVAGGNIVGSGNLYIDVSGTLDMGTQTVTAAVGTTTFNDGATIKTAVAGGIDATFLNTTARVVGAAVNYEFYNSANVTGFVKSGGGANFTGAGASGNNIVIMNNLTLSNCSFSFTAAETGNITINGNLSKTGSANAAPATGGIITMGGATSSISNAGGGRLGIWQLVIDGANVTTDAGFELNTTGAGSALTVNSGKKFTASSGTVTINGAAPASPAIVNNVANAITDLTFYNLEIGQSSGSFGACASPATTSSFVISGSLSISHPSGTFDATAGTIRMTGTGNITNAGAIQSHLAFYDLDITGNVTGVDAAAGFSIRNNLSVAGSLTVNGSAALDRTLFAGSSDQSHYITGTGTMVFFGLVSDAGDPIYTNSNITINGDVAGALDCSGSAASGFVAYPPSTVTLAKTAVSANNFLTQNTDNVIFNNLTVSGTDVDNNVNFKVKGNLTVNSGASFVSSAGIITMDSTTAKTITNDGTLTFYDLNIENALTASGNSVVTTASPFSFASGGNITVAADGQFEATAGIITFVGGGAFAHISNNATAGATALKFYSLQISTATTFFEDAKQFYINGNLTADANFGPASGAPESSKIYFGGSTEQFITVNGAAVVSLDDAEINNSAGVKLAGSPSIGVDDLAIYKTLRLQSGDLDLNGNHILTIKYNTGNGKLEETPGNTVINSGAETSTGHVYITNAFGAVVNNENFGGLGAQITTDVNPGTLTVKRYHIAQRVGSASGPPTISRYYSITSSVATGLNALFVFKYDDSELGDIDESSLSLLSASTDPISTSEVWRAWSGASHDIDNNLLILSGLDNFTAATERQYWTAAAVSKVTITTLTKGVHEGGSVNGKLTAGRDKQAVFGFKAVSDGEVSLTSLTFSMRGANDILRNLANPNPEFLKYALIKSIDDDLGTTNDNDTLVSNLSGAPNNKVLHGDAGKSFVGFDLSAAADKQTFTAGVPYHYFLVVRMNHTSNITSALDTLQIKLTHDELTLDGGIVNAATLTGTKYTFQPGLTIAYIADGLADSPLRAGATTQAVMGFSALATNTATLRSFDVSFAPDITNKISNLKVYRSTDRSFATTSDNTLLTTEVNWNGNTAEVTFGSVITPTDENILTTARYYFVTADVAGQVNESSTGLQASISHDDLTSVTAGARYSTAITGKDYTFDIARLTVSTENTPASRNLGSGVVNQPVFGFTLTPSSPSTVAFTAATLKVKFDNGALNTHVTSYRLWYDANGDGYPQSTETSWVGTYSGSTSEGYVTFPTVTGQTFSAARKYILTVNLSNAAVANGTITAQVPDQSYITATSPAYVTAGGPWTGNAMTVKTPGTATKLVFVGYSSRAITTGSAIDVVIQQQDASGTPVNATTALAVTIAINQNITALGGTTTGSIAIGSDIVTISGLTLTNAAGTSSALVNATSSHPAATSASIKIYPTGPTSNGTLTLGTPTATTMPITIATIGDGTSRVIVMRQGQPPAAPTNGVSYSAVTNAANADVVGIGQTDAGSIVIYDGVGGIGTNFTVTGLTVGAEYYFAMYDYTGSGSLKNYYTTSVSVVNQATAEGTPASYGSHVTAGTAASISTDVDVYGALNNASEAASGKYYSFIVPAGRNNVLIRLSNLPNNYSIDLYSTATSPMRLMRNAKNSGNTDEVMIINNAAPGRYIIKVFGADSDQYSSSYYKLRVNTKATEYLSPTN